jgi:hypothetical protein
MAKVTLSEMLAAGTRAVSRRLALVAGLWGVGFAAALAYTFAAGMLLSGAFSSTPGFDRGVDGDLIALIGALRERSAVIGGLLWAAVGLALVWFVASQFLAAGALTRLRDEELVERREAARRFGAGAMAHGARFLALWAWSLVGWIPVLIVLGVGVGAGLRSGRDALAMSEIVGGLVGGAIPAFLLGTWLSLAVDLGRVLLVADPALPARRALWRGLGLALRQPRAVVHFLAYLAAWALVSGLYVLGTMGDGLAGAGGALLLLVLRQLVAFARTALRVGAWAGQQALVDGARPAP